MGIIITSMSSMEVKFYKADYTDWLMNPIRFPELVAEWWKERKVK